MALVSCPNCGEKISEKASQCVHCGFSLYNDDYEDEVVCDECGSVLAEYMDVCPTCGCPINKQKPQKVEVTNVRISVDRKKTKLIVSVLIALVIFVGAGIGVKLILDKNAEKAYMENYKKAAAIMLSGAADAESASGLIHDVLLGSG